jgi:hypothetical protein
MYPLEQILAAIAHLRDRLPELLGAERWPAFEHSLNAYLDDLSTQRRHPTMVKLLLLDLFMGRRETRTALLEIIDPERLAREGVTRSYDPTSTITSPSTDSPSLPLPQSPNLQSSPSTVTRYTDIACPRRVWIEGRMVAMVKLTVAPSPLSRATETLPVRVDQPVEVTLTALEFAVTGAATQSMAVLPDADSPAVYFELRPLRVGLATLFFDFRQAGQPLGRTQVAVEVTAQPVSEELVSHAGPRVVFDPTGAEPPEVQLDIHYDASGGHALIFTLYDRRGQPLTVPQRVPLFSDPRTYSAQVYARLSQQARDSSQANAAKFEYEARQLGYRLWKELLPQQIKDVYAAHRSTWAGRPLLVVSDEPWIPWELVWPHDDPHDEWRDHEPWAVTMALHRWLGGDAVTATIPGPPTRLRVAALACVAPQGQRLPHTAAERSHLQALAAQRGWRDLSPADARLESVLALLRAGGFGWLHFATHGELGDESDDVAIQLEEGETLRAENLYGPDFRPRIAQARPGVVLNICHGSRAMWSLTNLGGWAQWFLSAGASLFMAPLWTVTDERASLFARTFYDRLAAMPANDAAPTVASAVAAARATARGDGDPTWLAYSVYAHPHAVLAAAG